MDINPTADKYGLAFFLETQMRNSLRRLNHPCKYEENCDVVVIVDDVKKGLHKT